MVRNSLFLSRLKNGPPNPSMHLKIETARTYHRLVNLHKSDGGVTFKIVALSWSVGLLIIDVYRPVNGLASAKI